MKVICNYITHQLHHSIITKACNCVGDRDGAPRRPWQRVVPLLASALLVVAAQGRNPLHQRRDGARADRDDQARSALAPAGPAARVGAAACRLGRPARHAGLRRGRWSSGGRATHHRERHAGGHHPALLFLDRLTRSWPWRMLSRPRASGCGVRALVYRGLGVGGRSRGVWIATKTN